MLVSAFVFLVNFKEFDISRALNLSLLVLGFIIIPVCLYILIQMKRGKYQNFDVSHRENRNSLYPIIILLQAVLFSFLVFKDYPWLIRSGLLSSLFLTTLGFFINQVLKVSMHTTVAFYLSVLLIHIEMKMAFTMLIFSALIAYSRVILGRHSVPEVTAGLFLGLISGGVFYWLINSI